MISPEPTFLVLGTRRSFSSSDERGSVPAASPSRKCRPMFIKPDEIDGRPVHLFNTKHYLLERLEGVSSI